MSDVKSEATRNTTGDWADEMADKIIDRMGRDYPLKVGIAQALRSVERRTAEECAFEIEDFDPSLAKMIRERFHLEGK